jgi:hypothetical protein
VKNLNANSTRRKGAYAYDEAQRIADGYLAGDTDVTRRTEQPWIEPPEEVPESEYWKILLDASRRAFPELVDRLINRKGPMDEAFRTKLLFDFWKAVHDRVRGGPTLNMTLQAEGMPEREATTDAWTKRYVPDAKSDS